MIFMHRTKLSTYYLILGLLLFPLGLLMLFGQPLILDFMTNIMPSTQTIEIFGLIIMFLGEGLICYGIVTTIFNRVAASAELNRQVLFRDVARNTQEQIVGVSRNMEAQIAGLNAKLDQIYQTNASARLAELEVNCRFCGTKMGQGRFCSSCGKAQN